MPFFGEREIKTTAQRTTVSDYCEILRVIWRNRYRDLGNGSNRVGNHWSMVTWLIMKITK